MGRDAKSIDVYIEKGEKRIFAGAIDWPGWCRSGRDEESALQSLADYGPRYARALHAAKLKFEAPGGVDAFTVAERLKGNTTTDFGAPDMPPSGDEEPIDDAELERLQAVLRACWKALEAAVRKATGQELRKGPRGGGRDLDKIVDHVLGANQGYLRSLAWKPAKDVPKDRDKAFAHSCEESLQALAAAAQGELPTKGPRGGKIWLPRYFVRRAAWHVLDHVWELEDRIV
jgi:hypothetical protein